MDEGAGAVAEVLGTAPGAVPRRTSALRVFLISFVILFGAGAIWSAATPLLAAPDEPAQIVKAAAVVHGQWTGCFEYAPKLGHCVPDPSNPVASEKLPAFFALVLAPDRADPSCFIHRPSVPATCERSLNGPPTRYDITVAYNQYAHTYVARYPPLYYLLVGLPSRLGGSTIDLYLMRLLSAAWSALLLAIAFTAALCWSSNRLLVLGVLGATTPMVFFLAGVINPSGLEISSAIAFWTLGSVLVTEQLDRPRTAVVVLTALTGATLANARSLSPLWVVLAGLALVLVASRRGVSAALADRRVRVGLGVVVLAGLGAVAWIVPEHALLQYTGLHSGIPASVSDSTIFETAFRHNSYYLADMVGVFGWFDTYSPLLTYLVWGAGILGLLGAAVALAGRRGVAVLGGLVVAVLLIPPVVVTSHAHRYGYNWSGRDTLPLAVGIPILAAALIGTGRARDRIARTTRRLAPWVAGAAGVAQFLAFYEALRRNSVGTHGALVDFVLHPGWRPAIGIVPALVLEAVALVLLVVLVLRGPRLAAR